MSEVPTEGEVRRRRLMEASPETLFLALAAAADGVDPNYRYLSGSVEPQGVLLFRGTGFPLPRVRTAPGPDYLTRRRVHQLLLLPASDPYLARWGDDARETTGEGAAERYGVDVVIDVKHADAALAAALSGGGNLSLLGSQPPSLVGPEDACLTLGRRVRDRLPGVVLQDGGAALDGMRAIKDEREVAAIERAIVATHAGLDRVAAALAGDGPPPAEATLEAELSYAYRTAGASHAFGAICAGGRNALQLHYRDNADTLTSDDLVLIDTGARVDGYCSDITRTLPVGGRFTPRQRELYEIVLEAQSVAIEHCVAGVTLADIHAFAFESIAKHGLGERFVHGIGHHLGLDVHDVPRADAPLAPGAVVTIEPGIYLEDEGVGIRIEDDVLVTGAGPRVLSAPIPKSVADVEAWLAGETSR